MEDWGIFRYILPALGGGFGVFFLIQLAQKPTDKKECFARWPVNFIMILGTLMFLALTWGVFFDNPPDDGLNDEAWLKPTFIIVDLIFLWFTPDTYFRRISWNDEGLTLKRFLRSERFVKWTDVSNLEYKEFFQYWRIGFKDGSGFIFYDMMRGSKELIEEYRHHLR